MYTVYKHIIPNGKIYIGITGRNPKIRWQNGLGYKKNKLFYRAIQKYGWENIQHEILYENITKEQAEILEIELILKYKSNNSKYGYNVSNGGKSSNYHSEQTKNIISNKIKEKWLDNEYRNAITKQLKGKSISKEQRKMISEKLKGRKLTQETKEKISCATKGKTNFKGKHHSKKTRKLLSKLRMGTKNPMYGKKLSNKRKEQISKQNQIKVICLDTGIIYNSIKECSKKTNSNKTCISLNCKGKLKTTNNLHFAYYVERRQ